ncbi:MAG: 30S ribosomal protein S13 [Methanomassiliicoccales archaeon]
MTSAEAENKDFHFVVHIANTDLDGNKKAVVGLMKIKGLGKRMAEKVVELAGIDRNAKLGSYSEEKYAEIEEKISSLGKLFPDWMLNRRREFETGRSRHAIGIDVDMAVREDINRMKMIRCYKGIRHETGQKVRGQRTRSNGRTGLTMGVTKAKGVQQAAAGEEPAGKTPSKPAPAKVEEKPSK